jgi:hypothetical protein
MHPVSTIVFLGISVLVAALAIARRLPAGSGD